MLKCAIPVRETSKDATMNLIVEGFCGTTGRRSSKPVFEGPEIQEQVFGLSVDLTSYVVLGN